MADYQLFDGFEAVGPLLLEYFPEEFERWVNTPLQRHRSEAFEADLETLRKEFERIKSDAHEWSEYVELWDGDLMFGHTHVLLRFEEKYLSGKEQELKMLVELAPGDWVEFDDFEFGDGIRPRVAQIHHIAPEDYTDTEFVADWIERNHGGYAAAIKKLIDPEMYNIDGEDELADAFQYVGEDCFCDLDGRLHSDEEIVNALVRRSTQFAEFKEIIENPEDERYELLLELAESEHPGFGGHMGLFADWSTK